MGLVKKICADKLIIWGDIHGSLDSLETLKNIENNPLFDGVNVFLGDYADRGRYGVEIIERVNDLIQNNPNKYIGLIGNHESSVDSRGATFRPFELKDEVSFKKNMVWKKYYEETFVPFRKGLYAAAIAEVNEKKYLLVHGGVCKEIRSIEDIESGEYDDNIYWSDPMQNKGQDFGLRGKGVIFGSDVTHDVCESLGIEAIIRSHDPMLSKNNPGIMHKGKIINISSTSEYGGKPYIIIIDENGIKGFDLLGNELKITEISPRG